MGTYVHIGVNIPPCGFKNSLNMIIIMAMLWTVRHLWPHGTQFIDRHHVGTSGGTRHSQKYALKLNLNHIPMVGLGQMPLANIIQRYKSISLAENRILSRKAPTLALEPSMEVRMLLIFTQHRRYLESISL